MRAQEQPHNNSSTKIGQHNNNDSPTKRIRGRVALIRNPKRVIHGLSRRLKNFRFEHTDLVSLVSKWEKEVVSAAPTIVTTEMVAKELSATNNSKNVFTIPNFPSEQEIKNFNKPHFHKDLSSTFAGMGSINAPHKNLEGLVELFEKFDIGPVSIIGMTGETRPRITFKGFLPTRQSMYDEMFNHSIGLIPFKRHWLHPYVSLSKAYEYAHAGLFVLCTSSYETIIKDLKEGCSPINDYDDLVSKLLYFKDNLEELYNKRQKIFENARQNLIWEKYEKNLESAYRLC